MEREEARETVQVSKTETRVRSYDSNGDVVAETVTVITHFEPIINGDSGTGMYL